MSTLNKVSALKDIVASDAITAGYGVASATIRKTANKVLGKRGIGQAGVNTVIVVSGMALSQVKNPYLNTLGSALRVAGIASFGNAIVEKLFSGSKKETEEK